MDKGYPRVYPPFLTGGRGREGTAVAERVSLTVDGYELEYSREPLLALFEQAERPWPRKGLGGTGWSGRMHAWALVPVSNIDPEGWTLVATEPETGMLGTVTFDPQGNAVAIRVSDHEPLMHGNCLYGLLSGWTNALHGAPDGPISSQGMVRARRAGDSRWEEAFLRVGDECGGSVEYL